MRKCVRWSKYTTYLLYSTYSTKKISWFIIKNIKYSVSSTVRRVIVRSYEGQAKIKSRLFLGGAPSPLVFRTKKKNRKPQWTIHESFYAFSFMVIFSILDGHRGNCKWAIREPRNAFWGELLPLPCFRFKISLLC